jgi:soluble lytic murein transglycosylase
LSSSWRTWVYFWSGEHRFDDLIGTAARQYGLPPALVKAVVWQESRFDPDARGSVGELGLMQVTEDAALEWAKAAKVPQFAREHLLDPRTNTLAGTYYLAKVLRRYTNSDNPLPYALADYNAGRGNVLRWMSGPAITNSQAFRDAVGFPTTRAYIDAVSDRYRHYRSEWR